MLWRSKMLSCLGLVLSMVLYFNTFAIPHEKTPKTKEHDVVMSEHMQDMYALKEMIPAEYRIMERTPIVPDEDSLKRGEELFEGNCVVCHGVAGDGKGPAAAGLPTPPANFLDREHSAIYGPGEKFWIIGNGAGETGMPPFKHIEPADRWHLVNYILHLQENSGPAPGTHHHHQ